MATPTERSSRKRASTGRQGRDTPLAGPSRSAATPATTRKLKTKTPRGSSSSSTVVAATQQSASSQEPSGVSQQATPSDQVIPVDKPSLNDTQAISPPSVVRIEDLHFTTHWRLLQKKEELYTRTHERCGTDDVYQEVLTWARSKVDTSKTPISRVSVLYYQLSKPRSQQKRHDIEEETAQEDMAIVLKQAISWYRSGARDISVDFEVTVAVEAMPTPVTQPRTSSSSRQTATSRQLAAAPAVIEQIEDDSDLDTAIRAEWTCSQVQCSNHGRWCYWIGSDTPENHYPITTEAVRVWSAEIKAKRLNKRSVSPMVLHLLSKAKDRQANQKHLRKEPSFVQQQGGGTGATLNVFIGNELGRLPPPWQTNLPLTPEKKRLSREQQLLSSSPVPVEQRRPATDELRRFFSWCADQPEWSADREDLELMETSFYLEGFDVRGIGRLTIEQWTSSPLNLRMGWFQRLQTSIRMWKSEGRPHGRTTSQIEANTASDQSTAAE